MNTNYTSLISGWDARFSHQLSLNKVETTSSSGNSRALLVTTMTFKTKLFHLIYRDFEFAKENSPGSH
jgi:hypothetical protein